MSTEDEDANPFDKQASGLFEYLFPDFPAAVAEGHFPVKFAGMWEVGRWVRSHDQGEIALRLWLTRPEADENSKRYASEWLRREEARRADDWKAQELQAAQSAVKAAQLSAEVARRSAWWTMWAAIFAGVGMVATAGTSLYSIFNSPQQPFVAPPQVLLLPTAPEATKVDTSRPTRLEAASSAASTQLQPR